MSDSMAFAISRLFDSPIAQQCAVHVAWVAIAVSSGALIAIPVGWLASRSLAVERLTRGVSGVISAVPALAWLAVCAAFLDGRLAPMCVVVACSTPSLVRGVLGGLRAVDPSLTDVAVALGLPAPTRIRFVSAPLALPALITGLRNAVTYASAATAIAGLVGAGGLGEAVIDGVLAGDRRQMLAGGVALGAVTLMLRATVTMVGRITPPLWGARTLHAGVLVTSKSPVSL